MEKGHVSALSITVITLIIIAIAVSGIYSVIQAIFLPSEDPFIILLAIMVRIMYLLGAGLILFGSILMAIRYVKAKLKDPLRPFGVAPRVVFLTMGLEIFIGAEIINTAGTRTWEDFLLLLFTISTRGLIGLILYLERRWCGEESVKEACIPPS